MTPYFITGLLALAVLAWLYIGKPKPDVPYRPDLSAVRQAYKAYYLHCLKKSPRRRGGRVK
jgi:hypothetical protein